MTEEQTLKLPTFTVGLSQSAKGFWYASEVKIRCENAIDTEIHLKNAIEIVKKQIETLNQKE